MKELKKYQGGGAVRAAKRMSKLLKPVKKGKYTIPAEYKNVPTKSAYIKTSKIPKGVAAKSLTKKYSKLLNPPTSTKRVKVTPKKRIDTYQDSKTKKTINKANRSLSDYSKKKLGKGFANTREYQRSGSGKLEKGIKGFGDFPDAGLIEAGYNLKKKYGKPKMIKGGSLRRSRTFK